MSKTNQGKFYPTNLDKCSKAVYIYKSSWELVFMRMCDTHPAIVEWDYESVKIPYQNPLTGKYTVYVPDFLIAYEDKKKNRRIELVEIKPKKETFVSEAKDKRSQLRLAVNAVKWKAAQEWCSRRGITFRVINEQHIFNKVK